MSQQLSELPNRRLRVLSEDIEATATFHSPGAVTDVSAYRSTPVHVAQRTRWLAVQDSRHRTTYLIRSQTPWIKCPPPQPRTLICVGMPLLKH